MPAVKVCPKCESENIKVDTDNARAAAGLSVPSYKCLDCGFSGQLFPGIDKEVTSLPATPAADSKDTEKIQHKEKV